MRKTIYILIGLAILGSSLSGQRIDILSPNGGEAWTLGSNYTILWAFMGIPQSALVKLVLFKDGIDASHKVGNIVENIPIGSTGVGNYTWKAGDYEGGTAALGGGYYIRIITMDGTQKDESNNPFTLSIGILGTAERFQPDKWIRVATPLADLTMTHHFRIGWNYAGVTRDLIINLISSAGSTYTIATGVTPGAGGGIGGFDWIVGRLSNPATTLSPGHYHIEVFETGTGIKGATRRFRINRPDFAVAEPGNFENLRRGQAKTIQWNAPDLRGRIHIEAWYKFGLNYSDERIKYTRLFSDVSNNGRHEWTVFPRPGSGYSEANPPPTGSRCYWFLRFISADCPGQYFDGGTFHIE